MEQATLLHSGCDPLTNLNQLYKSYELLRSAFSWMCQHLPSRQASCYHHTLSDELVADQVKWPGKMWQWIHQVAASCNQRTTSMFRIVPSANFMWNQRRLVSLTYLLFELWLAMNLFTSGISWRHSHFFKSRKLWWRYSVSLNFRVIR